VRCPPRRAAFFSALAGSPQPRPRRRYIRSLYFALSTMSSLGYGNAPVAITDAEYIFAILCQVTGACMYAAIFGNIAQLIAKLDASGARYQAQLDKINEFIHFHTLPNKLSKKLHEYNDFLFAVNRGFDVEQIASAMPPNLQQEVFLHLHEHLLRQVPMFENCDDAFIKALVQLLKPQVLLMGDCAFKVYEMGSTMYFIQNGCMQILGEADATHGEIIYCTLMAGSYFGELAMLTSQRRTATARAGSDCILFYMTTSDFELVIKDHPKYYDEILDKAMERLENTLRSNADAEVQMQQIEKNRALKADILRNKLSKGLGTASSAEQLNTADDDTALSAQALESAGVLRPGRRTSFKMGADGRPEPLPDPMGDIRRLTVGKQPEEPDSPNSPRSPASRKTSTWCARIPPPPLRAQPARALG